MRDDRMTGDEVRIYTDRLNKILMQHVGPGRKISQTELYRQTFLEDCDHNQAKRLRGMIRELRKAGIGICSSRVPSRGGYWLAASESELLDFCEARKTEALKVLALIAAMMKTTLPALLGQMQLNLVKRQHDENEYSDESGA